MSIYSEAIYTHPTIAPSELERPLRKWEKDTANDVYRCLVSLGFHVWYQLSGFDSDEMTVDILSAFFAEKIGFSGLTIKRFIHLNWYINIRVMAALVKMIDKDLANL